MALNIVRVNSDYKIQTSNAGVITLDTGVNVGEVIVTGNLTVKGDTSYFNVSDLQVEDNIILLNKGEIGNGVSEGTSGIEIARGSATYGNASMLWDEDINWTDPISGLLRDGLFKFQTNSGGINGIQTNSINTNGGDLFLINDGAGVISVTGTTNYEQQVLDYNNALLPIDSDIIPNIKAVTDKIAYEIINSPPDKIRRGDTEVIVYDNDISRAITYVQTYGAPSTNVLIEHNLTTNAELNITVGSFVTISGSGITNLDGTWQISIAATSAQFFNITTTLPVTATEAAFVGTLLLNNSKSNVRVVVDGTTYVNIQDTQADFYNIRIQDTTISSTLSNTDLVLTSPGTSSVQIQDSLRMPYTSDPSPIAGSVKIYTKAEAVGQTGIYFVNTNYSDELISKKKAIAFSILM
jgi:hypothetical protein